MPRYLHKEDESGRVLKDELEGSENEGWKPY